MADIIQAVRGMNDLLPDQTSTWQAVESIIKTTLSEYAYKEIRLPLLEKTTLFSRSIGGATDIVEKEMYTFADRNGDNLTLRPEGTAGCVRAGIQNGLFHNQTQRLWYMGPMFRHERPQKGRYRQFYQTGVECFGFDGPDIDCELIALSARIWRKLGLDNVKLELNSLGSIESRTAYIKVLTAYLSGKTDELDEDSKRRLKSNPLRVLDSKNPDMQNIIEQAPKLIDYLDSASQEHFDKLKEMLTGHGIEFHINPRLVRGLDYYSRTVFEWTTDQLGAQGAICAGGRFDGLVAQLGGKQVPAVGFAMGLERIIELVKINGSTMPSGHIDVYMCLLGDEAKKTGLLLAEKLRDKSLNVLAHCGDGSIKSQLKQADKSGAKLALILGEDEVGSDKIIIKPLREKKSQYSVDQKDLFSHLLP
ncbi:MAG: histidine--tRNA ligase [Acidiferrobacterales bacterium]